MSFFTSKISFGAFLRHKSAETETAQFGRDARADWQTICFVALLLNLCMVGVSIFVYAKINKGELFLVDKKAPVSVKTLDTFKLEQTISYFAEKQARFETLQERRLSTSDPYIPKVSPKQ